MFPLLSLPEDILYLVAQFLPYRDFLNLCECVDFTITRKQYQSLFKEKRRLKEHGRRQVRNRMRAEIVIFEEAKLDKQPRILTLSPTAKDSARKRVHCLGCPISLLSIGGSGIRTLMLSTNVAYIDYIRLARILRSFKFSNLRSEFAGFHKERKVQQTAEKNRKVEGWADVSTGYPHAFQVTRYGIGFLKHCPPPLRRELFYYSECRFYTNRTKPALGKITKPYNSHNFCACFIEDTGIVFWRFRGLLTVDINTANYFYIPTQVLPNTKKDVRDFAITNNSAIVLRTDGSATVVELLDTDKTTRFDGDFVLVAAHRRRFMLLTTDGSVAIGSVQNTNITFPKGLEGLDIASIAVGWLHYFAITQDGQLYTLGLDADDSFTRFPIFGHVYGVDVGCVWAAVLVTDYKPPQSGYFQGLLQHLKFSR